MDLRLRGPGQVLGTRHSGRPDLALASLADDGSVLEEAREEAADILLQDPELQDHAVLKRLLEEQRSRVTSAAQLN